MNENNVKVLELKAENATFTGLVKKANEDKKRYELSQLLQLDGYTINEEVSVKELSAKKDDQEINAHTVTQLIEKDGKQVGELIYLSSEQESGVSSIIKLEDGKSIVHYEEDGKLIRTLVEQNDDINALVTKKQCLALVGMLCSAGMGTGLSGCTAGCMTFGPAYAVCWPVCVGLIAVGCGYGANAACAWTN